MSNDRDSSPPSAARERRGSVTSAAFSSLFQRSNSTSAGSNGNGQGSAAAMARDPRRRLSVTTLGLSGGGPASATGALQGLRRGSISTNNSDSIDENAVEDDETSRTAPTTPFARRMSFGASAMRSMRAPSGTSPGSTGRPDPARRSSGGTARQPSVVPTSTTAAGRRTSTAQASTAQPARSPSDILSAARADQGFNWSEQLRSRAESSVSGMRPSFSMGSSGSPPRHGSVQHDRAKSVSDMPVPPQQAATLKPKQPERPKPDAMQERILKGDFYMD
ncbi:hypothetical protein JX265_006305 [Neoarthrinium moseri]|uniref:Uncharacterized protein n=1 Tax=Neoarthrinium moseri TaxID=1658444 RepID=A0A9P9WLZ2_9PEZI|nr:uncharacterized protein JN550_008305 [Neoarthrinium moseri]KAI1852255.1 hypothetical protein JX266_002433 [Neoarthrinium moseri]KAI1865548.1 hypothetical protein JN550_008305 [Neoarthrinium moseri]KAI1870135.1 hypothetical protein JX265_006305 [Neoarthrinium moseri]